jgi:hypothetical protein
MGSEPDGRDGQAASYWKTAGLATVLVAVLGLVGILVENRAGHGSGSSSGTTSATAPSEISGSTVVTAATTGLVTTSGPGSGASDKPLFTRTFRVPLPDTLGDYSSIYLDEGHLAKSEAASGVYYTRDENNRRPSIVFNSILGVTASLMPQGQIGRNECATAVDTSPLDRPIFDLESGTLICARSASGGIALLKILREPDSQGTLVLSEDYWTA